MAMRFLDLFAGLGGFHLALRKLGHRCVFACEIDTTLRELYLRNFGIEPAGDIYQVGVSDVPAHDILCAGFPCQPFSKAGSQSGLDEYGNGGVIYKILRIAKHHKPRYLILENVPNFERHDNRQTWTRVEGLLRAEGYDVRTRNISPHHFGIPQIRDRIYIVGSLASLEDFHWPDQSPSGGSKSVCDVLDTEPGEARRITEQVARCLEVWQDFLYRYPKDEKVLHPIWSMEFGATYPFEKKTPHCTATAELRRCLGSHGRSLEGLARDELLKMLPSHARAKEAQFPHWKVHFIRKNREFYHRNKAWIDQWKPRIMEFPSSFQKLEWNCQGEPRDLYRCVIQIRPSGVRVKRPTTCPSLVAMTSTQVPIIPWEGRYITPAECKRLQSMEDLEFLPESANKAYEALGNAVNVVVARLVADALLRTSTTQQASHEALCPDAQSTPSTPPTDLPQV